MPELGPYGSMRGEVRENLPYRDYCWRIRQDGGKRPKRWGVPNDQTGEQKVNPEFANSILPLRGNARRPLDWTSRSKRIAGGLRQ